MNREARGLALPESVTEVGMRAGWATRRSRAVSREMSRTERALAESNERYRSLFEYNPHAAFSLDLEGRFTAANVIAEDVSGYTASELAELNFSQLICTDHLPRAHAAFAAAVNREPQKLEANMWHRDGHVMELSLTVVPVVVYDEVVGVHGIAENVTERNMMRRELERNRQLAQEANAAKSIFLANMSHEVRTPLTSVLGAAELLVEGGLTPGQDRLVEIVHRAGQRLLRLVNDILDISRIEAGKVDVHREPIDLRALLAETAEWATPMARKAGVDFSCTLEPGLPATILGDALRISQVLTNLLGNALKFTEHGSVRLVVGPTRAGQEPPGVRFVVEDTGIGIRPADLETLFASFTQVDPSATRKHGGAGLGLAISRELVTMMDGTIGASSVLGEGSTFTVTLPVTDRVA